MQKPKRRSFNRGNKLPWLAGLAAPAAFLHALPNGGEVKAGSADITASASSDLLISQQSDRAVIHWSDFDIDKGETVTFRQPSRDAWVLNRDTSGAASNILGDLNANGGVFLLNPHGILVGDGARLDVGSLLMTTADIESEDDFMNGGNIRFSLGASAHTSRLLNQGEIRTQEGGFIGLIGARVENRGKIAAAGGVVQIASSKSFYVDFTGDSLIGFETSSTDPIAGAGIEQTDDGSIEAGTVIMTAHTAKSIMDRVINLDGVVQARKLSGNGGRVVLNAGAGHVEVQGSVDAGADGGPDRPPTADGAGDGGQLDIFGAGIILAEGSELRTDGEKQAGTIRVGGDFQGNTALLPDKREQVTLGPIQNAQSVLVQSGALIQNRASVSFEKPQTASSSDAQHSAIFWADKGMGFYGTVDASGGESGGFIEISGKDGMKLGHSITINAASVLFDPWQVTWQAGSTSLTDNEKEIHFGVEPFDNLTIDQSFWSQFQVGSGIGEVTIQARNRISVTGNVNPPAGVNRSFNLSLMVSAYGGTPAGNVDAPGIVFINATLGTSSNNKINYLYISANRDTNSSFQEPFISLSGGSIYAGQNFSIDGRGSVMLNSVFIASGRNMFLHNILSETDYHATSDFVITNDTTLSAVSWIAINSGRNIIIDDGVSISGAPVTMWAVEQLSIKDAEIRASNFMLLYAGDTGAAMMITSASLLGGSVRLESSGDLSMYSVNISASGGVNLSILPDADGNSNIDISLLTIVSEKSHAFITAVGGSGNFVLAGSTISALSGSIIIGGDNHNVQLRKAEVDFTTRYQGFSYACATQAGAYVLPAGACLVTQGGNGYYTISGFVTAQTQISSVFKTEHMPNVISARDDIFFRLGGEDGAVDPLFDKVTVMSGNGNISVAANFGGDPYMAGYRWYIHPAVILKFRWFIASTLSARRDIHINSNKIPLNMAFGEAMGPVERLVTSSVQAAVTAVGQLGGISYETLNGQFITFSHTKTLFLGGIDENRSVLFKAAENISLVHGAQSLASRSDDQIFHLRGASISAGRNVYFVNNNLIDGANLLKWDYFDITAANNLDFGEHYVSFFDNSNTVTLGAGNAVRGIAGYAGANVDTSNKYVLHIRILQDISIGAGLYGRPDSEAGIVKADLAESSTGDGSKMFMTWNSITLEVRMDGVVGGSNPRYVMEGLNISGASTISLSSSPRTGNNIREHTFGMKLGLSANEVVVLRGVNATANVINLDAPSLDLRDTTLRSDEDVIVGLDTNTLRHNLNFDERVTLIARGDLSLSDNQFIRSGETLVLRVADNLVAEGSGISIVGDKEARISVGGIVSLSGMNITLGNAGSGLREGLFSLSVSERLEITGSGIDLYGRSSIKIEAKGMHVTGGALNAPIQIGARGDSDQSNTFFYLSVENTIRLDAGQAGDQIVLGAGISGSAHIEAAHYSMNVGGGWIIHRGESVSIDAHRFGVTAGSAPDTQNNKGLSFDAESVRINVAARDGVAGDASIHISPYVLIQAKDTLDLYAEKMKMGTATIRARRLGLGLYDDEVHAESIDLSNAHLSFKFSLTISASRANVAGLSLSQDFVDRYSSTWSAINLYGCDPAVEICSVSLIFHDIVPDYSEDDLNAHVKIHVSDNLDLRWANFALAGTLDVSAGGDVLLGVDGRSQSVLSVDQGADPNSSADDTTFYQVPRIQWLEGVSGGFDPRFQGKNESEIRQFLGGIHPGSFVRTNVVPNPQNVLRDLTVHVYSSVFVTRTLGNDINATHFYYLYLLGGSNLSNDAFTFSLQAEQGLTIYDRPDIYQSIAGQDDNVRAMIEAGQLHLSVPHITHTLVHTHFRGADNNLTQLPIGNDGAYNFRLQPFADVGTLDFSGGGHIRADVWAGTLNLRGGEGSEGLRILPLDGYGSIGLIQGTATRLTVAMYQYSVNNQNSSPQPPGGLPPDRGQDGGNGRITLGRQGAPLVLKHPVSDNGIGGKVTLPYSVAILGREVFVHNVVGQTAAGAERVLDNGRRVVEFGQLSIFGHAIYLERANALSRLHSVTLMASSLVAGYVDPDAAGGAAGAAGQAFAPQSDDASSQNRNIIGNVQSLYIVAPTITIAGPVQANTIQAFAIQGSDYTLSAITRTLDDGRLRQYGTITRYTDSAVWYFDYPYDLPANERYTFAGDGPNNVKVPDPGHIFDFRALPELSHSVLPFLSGVSLPEGNIGARRRNNHQPFDISFRPAQSFGFFTLGNIVMDGGDDDNPARNSIGWLQAAGRTLQFDAELIGLADGYAEEYLGLSGKTIEHLPGTSLRHGEFLVLSVDVSDTLSLRVHAGEPIARPRSDLSNIIQMQGSVGGLMDLSLSNAAVLVVPEQTVSLIAGGTELKRVWTYITTESNDARHWYWDWRDTLVPLAITKKLGPGLRADTANITLHGKDISWYGGLSVDKALGLDFDGTLRPHVYIEEFRGPDGRPGWSRWVTQSITVNQIDLQFSENTDLDTLTFSAKIGKGLTIELTSSHYIAAATHPLTGLLVSTGGEGLLVMDHLVNHLSITGVQQGNLFVDGGRLHRPDFYTVIENTSLYIDNLEATLSVMDALASAAVTNPLMFLGIGSFNSNFQVFDSSVVINLMQQYGEVITVDLSHLDHSLYFGWRKENDPNDTAAYFKRPGHGVSLAWNSYEQWGQQSTSLRAVLDSFNRSGLTVSVEMDTRESGLNANARVLNATFASLGADGTSPGSLVLGDIKGVVGGNYTLANGRIFQKAGTSINVSGGFGVAAPGVTLTNPGNHFGRLSVDQLSHAEIPAASTGLTVRAESGFDLYAGGAVDLFGGKPYANKITVIAERMVQPGVSSHLNPDGTPMRVRLMGARNHVSLTVTAGAFEVNGRIDGNLTAYAPGVGELANMTISAELGGEGRVKVIDAMALQGGVTVHSLVGMRQSYPLLPGFFVTLPSHISIRSGRDIVGNARITAYGSLDLLARRNIYLTNVNSTLSGGVFASAAASVDLRAQHITIGNLHAGQGAHLSAQGDVVGLDRTATAAADGNLRRIPIMVHVNEGLTVSARNLIWNDFTRRHISIGCDAIRVNQCRFYVQDGPFDPNLPIQIAPSESVDFVLAVPGHVGLFADDETDFSIRAPSAEHIGTLGVSGRSVYISLPAGGPAGCQPPDCALRLDRVSATNLTIELADRDLAQLSVEGIVTQTLSARTPYEGQKPDANGYYYSVRPDGVTVSSMQVFPAYLPDAAGYYYTVIHHVLVTQTHVAQLQIDLRDFLDFRSVLSATAPFPSQLPDADGYYYSVARYDVQVSSTEAFPAYVADADGYYYSVLPDGLRVSSKLAYPGYQRYDDGYYYSLLVTKGVRYSSMQVFPEYLPQPDGYYYTVLPESALPANMKPIVIDQNVEVVLTETVHLKPTFSADTVRLIGGGNNLTLGNIGNNISTLSLENWKHASVWAKDHLLVSIDDVQTLNLRAYLPAGDYIDGVHEQAITQTIRASGNNPELIDSGTGRVVVSKMVNFCDYVSCEYHMPLNRGKTTSMLTFVGEPYLMHKHVTRGLGFTSRSDTDRASNITVVGTAGLKHLEIDGAGSGQVTISYSNNLNLGRVYAGGLSLFNAPQISGVGDISLRGGGLYLSSDGRAVFRGDGNRVAQTLVAIAGHIGTLMATDVRAGLLVESRGDKPAIHGLNIGNLSAGHAQIDLRSGRMSISGLLQAGESLQLTATDAIVGGSIRSNEAPVVLKANHINLKWLSGSAAKYDDESHGLANFTLSGIGRARAGFPSGVTISAIDAGKVNRVSVSAPGLGVSLNFGSARQPNLLIYAAGHASISAGEMLNLMGAIVDGDMHAHVVGSITYLQVSDTLGVVSPGSISIGGALHAGGQVVRLDHGSVAMDSLVLYSRSDGPSSSVTVVNAGDLELYFADYQMRKGDGKPGGFAEMTVHADGDLLLAEGSAAIHGDAHLSARGNVSELYTSASKFLHFVSTNAAGEVVTVSKNGNQAEVEVTGASMWTLQGSRPVYEESIPRGYIDAGFNLRNYVTETITAVANGDWVSMTLQGQLSFSITVDPTQGANGKWTITEKRSSQVGGDRLFVLDALNAPTTLYPNASFTQVLTPTAPQGTTRTFTLSYIFSQSFDLATDKGVVPIVSPWRDDNYEIRNYYQMRYYSVGFKSDMRIVNLPVIPRDAGLGSYDFANQRWSIELPNRDVIVRNIDSLDDLDFASHFPLTMAGSGYTEVFHLRPATGAASGPDRLVMEVGYQFSQAFNLVPSNSVAILNSGERTVFSDVGVPGNLRNVTVPRSGEVYIPVMTPAEENIDVQVMRHDRFGVHFANFTISGRATMTADANLDHIKLTYGNQVKTVQLDGFAFAANFPLTLNGEDGGREVISHSIVRGQGVGQVTNVLLVDYVLYPRVYLSGNQITALPDGATTVFNNVGVVGNYRNITVVREGVFAETEYADGANLTVGGVLRIDSGGTISQRPNSDLGQLSIFSGPGYTLTEAGPIGSFLITGSYTQQQPTLTFRRVEYAPNQFSLEYNTGYETIGGQSDQIIANVAGRRVQMALGVSNEVAVGGDSKLKVVPVFSRRASTGETVLVLSISYDLIERVNMMGVRVSALNSGRRLVKDVGIAGIELRDIILPEQPSRLRPFGGMTVESLVARADGDMHLYQLGNNFGWVSARAGGSIHLLDEADHLTLGGISADRFTLSALGVGDVHGSGPVTAGLAILSAPSGSIGLTAVNHISSLVLSAQHGTVINGPGPSELAVDISVLGDMTLSAAQRVTQAADLTVGRMLSIRAVGSNGREDIVLDRSGNRLVTFAGVGAKVTLVDGTDGIELKDRLQANSLSIRQIHGNINAPGVLEIDEELEISALQGNIQLPNKANRFNTLVSLTASGNVVLHEYDGFTLGGNVEAGSGRVVLGAGAGGIYGVGRSVVAGSQDVIISARGDVSIDLLTAKQGDVFFTVWGDASFSLISASHAGYPDSGRVSASVYGDLTVENVVDLENDLKIYARDDLRIATVSQRGGIRPMHITAGGDASIGTLTAASQGAQIRVDGDFSIMHVEANGNIRIQGGQDGSLSLLHARGTNTVIVPGIFTSYLGNAIQIFVQGDLNVHTVRNQQRDAFLNGDQMQILVGGSLSFSQLLGNGNMLLSVAGDMQGDHARVSFAWLHATVGETVAVRTLDAQTSLTVSARRDILGRRWLGREGDVALSAPGTISLTDNLTGVQAGANLQLSAGYGLYDPVATVMENGDIVTVRLGSDGDVRVSMTHGAVFDTVDLGRVTVRANGDVSLVPMSDGSTFTISRGELSTVIAGATIAYSRRGGSLTFTRLYNQIVTLESEYVSVLPGAARTVVDVGVRGHKVTVVRAGIGIAGEAEAGQTLELIAAGSVIGGPVRAGNRLGVTAGGDIALSSAVNVNGGGVHLSANGGSISISEARTPADGAHRFIASAYADIAIHSLTVGELGATLSAGGDFKIHTASLNRLEAAGATGAVYEYGEVLTLGDLTVGDFTLIMTSTLSNAVSGDVRQDTAAAGATVGSFSFQGGNLNLTHSANSLDTVHLIDLPGPVVTSSTSIEIDRLIITNTGALVLVPLPGTDVTLSLPAGANRQVVNGTSYVLNTIGSYVYVTTHLAAKTINIVDNDDLFIDASYLANHFPDGTLEIGGIHLMGGGHLTLQASGGYVHGRSITAGSFTLDAARADLYGALAGQSTGEAADHLFVNAENYVGPYLFNGRPGWQGRQTGLDHQDIGDWWQEGARFANDALETGHEIGELAEARYAARTGRPHAGWFFGGAQLDNFVVVRLSRPLINLLGLSEEDEQPILLFSQDEDEDE